MKLGGYGKACWLNACASSCNLAQSETSGTGNGLQKQSMELTFMSVMGRTNFL